MDFEEEAWARLDKSDCIDAQESAREPPVESCEELLCDAPGNWTVGKVPEPTVKFHAQLARSLVAPGLPQSKH